MKTTFYEFITESKNYPIFKGVADIKKILKSGYIKDSGDWKSSIRRNMGVEHGISVSRSFKTAYNYGSTILEFDTQKLSDNYKIIPFSENPDYYLGLGDKFDSNIAKNIRMKEYGEDYWKVKTDKYSADFGIAEEIILAKEISIKYIKKAYIIDESSSVIKLLDKHNIPYENIEYSDRYLSKIKKKKDRIKTYSQQ